MAEPFDPATDFLQSPQDFKFYEAPAPAQQAPVTQIPFGEDLVEPGNIDLNNRPIVYNPDGSISTEQSFSISENGTEVLIPQVVYGQILPRDAAIEHYQETGKHLGKFSSSDAAD